MIIYHTLCFLVGLDISSSFTPRYSGPAYQSYRQVLQSQQSALQQQKATNPRGVNPRISHSLQHPPTATPDSGNVLITVIRQYQYILFCLFSLQGGLLGTYCKDGNILVRSHFLFFHGFFVPVFRVLWFSFLRFGLFCLRMKRMMLRCYPSLRTCLWSWFQATQFTSQVKTGLN